jgi:hypothetical protein
MKRLEAIARIEEMSENDWEPRHGGEHKGRGFCVFPWPSAIPKNNYNSAKRVLEKHVLEKEIRSDGPSSRTPGQGGRSYTFRIGKGGRDPVAPPKSHADRTDLQLKISANESCATTY